MDPFDLSTAYRIAVATCSHKAQDVDPCDACLLAAVRAVQRKETS